MDYHRRVDLKHQAWTCVRSSSCLDFGVTTLAHEKKPAFGQDDNNKSVTATTTTNTTNTTTTTTTTTTTNTTTSPCTPTLSLTVSTFIPPGFAHRLGWLDPLHYLLCVGYAERGDFQLGISGTCWKGEDKDAALEREVQEETGMLLKSSPSFEDFGVERRFNPRFRKPRTYAYFGITPLTLAPGGFPYTPESRTNDKARKIVALIHGPLKEMQALLTTIRDQPGFAADGIDRYAVLSVEDAIDLATHLPSTCGLNASKGKGVVVDGK